MINNSKKADPRFQRMWAKSGATESLYDVEVRTVQNYKGDYPIQTLGSSAPDGVGFRDPIQAVWDVLSTMMTRPGEDIRAGQLAAGIECIAAPDDLLLKDRYRNDKDSHEYLKQMKGPVERCLLFVNELKGYLTERDQDPARKAYLAIEGLVDDLSTKNPRVAIHWAPALKRFAQENNLSTI